MNSKVEEYYRKVVDCSAQLIQAAGRAMEAEELLAWEKEQNIGIRRRYEELRIQHRKLKKEFNRILFENEKLTQKFESIKRRKCVKMVRKLLKKTGQKRKFGLVA